MSNPMASTRLELLRIARELVINEYIDKRAQDHNNWLAESEVAWKTKGIKLPYPPFPSYPNEADIIARANALDQFLNKTEPAPVHTTTDAVIVTEQTVEQPQAIATSQPLTTDAATGDGVLGNLTLPPSGSLLTTAPEAKKESKSDLTRLASVLPSWLSKNNGEPE